jgi:GTP-binding protein EngB required for normal cell division
MIGLLKENNFDFIIIANKIDKISKGARLKNLKEISHKLGTEEIVLFSAKTGEGRDELFEKLKIKN